VRPKKNLAGIILPLTISLLCIVISISPYISPSFIWWIDIIAHLTLPLLIINIILVPFLIYKKHWFSIVAIIILIIVFPSITRIYVFPENKENELHAHQNSFRILSYNTSFSKVKKVFSDEYYLTNHNIPAKNIKDWLTQSNADIICLQEFYDDENSEIYNNLATISKKDGYGYYFLSNPLHDNGTKRGIITFTKHPIVDKGTIFLSENRFNGAIYTDLKIGDDTIRVINLHLESYNLFESNSKLYKINSIRSSINKRNNQVEKVIEHINQSPYEVVVCGDFNTPPYSYTYRRFSSILHNSFEKKGKGSGSTFQNKLNLPILRIDNQFFAPSLEVQSFVTYTNITYSDHLPIEAKYTINP